jgi:hypothetical protein
MTLAGPKRVESTADLRKFGLLVGSVFLLIALYIRWRHGDRMTQVVAFGVLGLLLVLFGGIAPRALKRPYAAWMALAHAMSKVTTPIFMGIIYFVVLTPIGVVLRAVGRDSIWSRPQGSQWVTRPTNLRQSVLERQF